MKMKLRMFLNLAAVVALSLGLSACDGGKHDDHDHGDESGHKDHDHGDESGHDHGQEGGGHSDHGERHELGSADIGAFKVSVASIGEIEAAKEGVLDIKVAGGNPSVVRAWIGVKSAKGSLKAKLERTGETYHGHVEVPATLPGESAVWVEVEDAAGKKSQASFKLE